MTTFTIISDLPAVQQALELYQRRGVTQALENWLFYFQDKTDARYQEASEETPYAPASIGTTQEFSGRIRGYDAKFGIDSGRLKEEVINSITFTPEGVTSLTTLDYAEYVLGLIQKKGPFEEGILFIDAEDARRLEQEMGDAWNQTILAQLLNFAKRILGL